MGTDAQSRSYEMASVLFTDIVSYSLQTIDRQDELLSLLEKLVRESAEFQRSRAANELISLPTGDGMALVFLRDPVSPVKCALEIASSLREHPEVRLRMGIHTGPVCRHADIKDEINVVGGGINMAQRVMDCGDAGHILLSGTIAEVLEQLSEWRECLSDLGVHEVKHGVKVHLYSLSKDGLGNRELPAKLSQARPLSTSESQERALDVAMAKQLPVHKPAELVALIRRLESEGLKGILMGDPDFSVSAEDVRSKPLMLEFPLDPKGKPGPLNVALRIDSPDFEPKTQNRIIRVPPSGDSEPHTFLLTPLYLGDLTVRIELYAGEIAMLSRVLRTCAMQSDRVPAGVPAAVISIPLQVVAASSTAQFMLPLAPPMMPPPAPMPAPAQAPMGVARPMDAKAPRPRAPLSSGLRTWMMALAACCVALGTLKVVMLQKGGETTVASLPEARPVPPSAGAQQPVWPPESSSPSAVASQPPAAARPSLPSKPEAPATRNAREAPVEPPSPQPKPAESAPVASTPPVSAAPSPRPANTGKITWTGDVDGALLVTIGKDRADVGSITGALPGAPCTIEPVEAKSVEVVSAPGEQDQYSRLVIRVSGHGPMTITLNWKRSAAP